MPEESTAVTSQQALEASARETTAHSGPQFCAGCGLGNPSARRSCLACGAPLGMQDEVASPLPIDPPLLEREAETAALDAAVRRFVAERKGGLVTVLAARGTGTTRLLRHAAERLLAAQHTRIFSTTVREADGPYAPVTRLLWERFGITPAKAVQAARGEMVAEVHRVLSSRGGPPTEHARRLVVAAGLPSDASASWENSAQNGIPRLAESLTRFLIADAEAQPFAVLVDNLDAASDDGLALFQGVLAAAAKAPVLVVVVGEPSLRERLAAPQAVVVEPRLLSTHACEVLCRHLLPGLAHLPEELVHAVVTRADGAPGRLREIVLALIESRVVVLDELPWRIDLAALGADGPVSSGDLVKVRLARLDARAKDVLARAAIVGEVFWEGAVVAMARDEEGAGDPFGEDAVESAVRESLRQLVALELLSPIEESELPLEREYAFAVAGLREATLAENDPARRARRHDVCAAWLELAAGARADDLSRAIAGHLERAGLASAAAAAYLRAARAARASYRGPQAVQLFDKALALLAGGDAPTRVDALHDKGVVLSLLGRVDEAAQSFTEMLVLAHRFGARNKMAAALGRLGRLARGRGDLAQAQQLLWRALELFQLAEDLRGVAAVHDDLGAISLLTGDFDTAAGHSGQALELRRALNDGLGEGLSTYNLGLVHHARGQPRQARAHFERSLALREKHGDIEGQVVTRNALAVLAFERGDIEQAEAIWGEIVELAQALGDKRMIVYVTGNLGEAAMLRGDTMRATQLLDAAEQQGNEIGDRRAVAEVERMRGAMARLAGDGPRAQAHLERSLAIARSLGVREAEALALRGLGEVSAMTMFDASDEGARRAEDYFHEATRMLEELGATRELARTRAIFGAYLVERGDVLNGRKVLTLAVPVLEQLDLAEAVQARATLRAAGGEVLIPGVSG